MARIEHIKHRLERWAIWMHKGQSAASGGLAGHPMWKGYRVDNEERREATIPISDLECSETHDAVQALPDPLAITVVSYYVKDSERTRRDLGISRSVLSQRLERADKLLEEALRKPASAEASMLPGWCAGSFTP